MSAAEARNTAGGAASHYRDPAARRLERVWELQSSLVIAEDELARLEARQAELERAVAEALSAQAGDGAWTRFRLGVGVGAVVAFLMPFFLLTMAAGARLPLATVFRLFR